MTTARQVEPEKARRPKRGATSRLGPAPASVAREPSPAPARALGNRIRRMTLQAAPRPSIQRHCKACEEEREEEAPGASPSVPPVVRRMCQECEEEDEVRTTGPRIQPRLEVGPVDDPYEREADRTAARVMRSASGPVAGAPPPRVVRAAEPGAPGAGGGVTDLGAGQLTGGGAPLAPPVRSFFEGAFGRDLSDVRVHTGETAHRYSDRLGAHAFTYDRHIWLGRSQRPEPSYVMAHEMAHVVQQTQPTVRPARSAEPAGRADVRRDADPLVRRLGLSAPFWLPLTAKGKASGSNVHTELEHDVLTNGQNSKLQAEAPVPNANREAWGLGLWGKADFYQAAQKTAVGIYFVPRTGQSVGQQFHGSGYGIPTEHPEAKHFSRLRPRLEDGKIKNIGGGPKTVRFGDLKPAALPVLRAGKEQLGYYAEGFKDAADQTNRWAADHSGKGTWKLNSVGTLPNSGVKFSSQYDYDPKNPRNDRALALFQIDENPNVRGGYSRRLVFNPGEHGLTVNGGLYADAFGQGLWIYFARPADLQTAFQTVDKAPTTSRNKTTVKAHIQWAQDVQNEVIGNLKKPPAKRVKLLPRPDRKIQRKKKGTPKLEDGFDLKAWTATHDRVGKAIGGKEKKTEDVARSLELLDLAYRAESGLDAVSATGKSTLPEKKSLEKTIKGEGGVETTRRALPDFYRWIRAWTSPPTKILGKFRARFGGAFTAVVNKLASLKQKVKERLDKVFKKRSGGRTGIAKLVIKGLGTALLAIGKLVVPPALHLVVDAVRRGIAKKLKGLFDLDEDSLAGKALKKFEALRDRAQKLQDNAQAMFDSAVQRFEDQLGPVKDVLSLAGKVGPILEAGMVLLQCGSPPLVGCLKLLARSLVLKATEAVLDLCSVRRAIASLILRIHFFKTLPNGLAEVVMAQGRKTAESLKLDVVKEIFSEPLDKAPAPDADDIPCDSGGAKVGTGPGSEVGDKSAARAVAELATEAGTDKLDGLSRLMDAQGVPRSTPLTAELAGKLRKLLRGVSADDLQALASGLASPELEKKNRELLDLLDQLARDQVLKDALARLRKGELDKELDRMRRERQRWTILGKNRPGSNKNRPLLVQRDGEVAVGVADVVLGRCVGGGVPLRFERVELRDRRGEKLDIPLPTGESMAKVLTGCGVTQPKPPKPPPGSKPESGRKPPGGAGQGKPPAGKPPTGPSQGTGPTQGEPEGDSKKPPPAGSGKSPSPSGGPAGGEPESGDSEGSDDRDDGGAGSIQEFDDSLEPGGEDTPEKAPEPHIASPEPRKPDPAGSEPRSGNALASKTKGRSVVHDPSAGPGDVYEVSFENLGKKVGWLVVPVWPDTQVSGSILRPRQPKSPLELRQTIDGLRVVNVTRNDSVEFVVDSANANGWYRMRSGPLYDELLGALVRSFIPNEFPSAADVVRKLYLS